MNKMRAAGSLGRETDVSPYGWRVRGWGGGERSEVVGGSGVVGCGGSVGWGVLGLIVNCWFWFRTRGV